MNLIARLPDDVPREDGAVAANRRRCTSRHLLEALEERGIAAETLTFMSARGPSCRSGGHRRRAPMHAEWGRIDRRDRRALKPRESGGRPLIAVGTTSLRLAKARDKVRISRSRATRRFHHAGYRFKAVDGLVTNFHLPRSTLFMLVSALMGLDAMNRPMPTP